MKLIEGMDFPETAHGIIDPCTDTLYYPVRGRGVLHDLIKCFRPCSGTS